MFSQQILIQMLYFLVASVFTLGWWLFSVATTCRITYTALQRGGCVPVLGGEYSYVCICAQNDHLKILVVYVHWYPVRWICIADGSRSSSSPWRWVGALLAIRLNGRRVICVLGSSVANAVETVDRWNARGLLCGVNFSGIEKFN